MASRDAAIAPAGRGACTNCEVDCSASASPFGLAGGAPGAKGRNWVERPPGAGAVGAGLRPVLVPMTGTDKCEVDAGDVFVVETPGGGGYGVVAEMRKAAE